MRILIIGTLYEPDLGPSAPLFSTLCKELVRSQHDVTVIAPVPHYPSGRVAKQFRGRPLWYSIEEGVKVIRIGIPTVDRSILLLRLIQFAFYQMGTAWAILTGRKFDVVLAGSSSLSVWLPFAVLKMIFRTPAVYSVQDLYPNVGITLGIFRNRFVIGAISALEKFILNRAEVVQIISDSFRPGLHHLGVCDSKISLVYNWIDTEAIRPMPRSNEFSKAQILDQYFVVLYSGNIGLSQGLESVLAAAEILKDRDDILFVLVGEGAAKTALVKYAEDRSITNVLFLPFQPRQILPQVLASANVAVIPLRRGIEMGSLPSKLFTVLASGRPILACVEKESEMWRLVERAHAGVHVPPEDPAALSQAILMLRDNRTLCDKMGQNGRIWAEQNHSLTIARANFERLFSQAIQNKKR